MVYDQAEIKYSDILKQQMAAANVSTHGGLIATANGGVNLVDEISLMKHQQQQQISMDSFGHLQSAEYLPPSAPSAEDASSLDQQFLQSGHSLPFASNAQGTFRRFFSDVFQFKWFKLEFWVILLFEPNEIKFSNELQVFKLE